LVLEILTAICLWPFPEHPEPASIETWMSRLGAASEPARVSRAVLEAVARLSDPEAVVFDDEAEAHKAEVRPAEPPEWRDLGEGLVVVKPSAFDESLAGLVVSAITYSASSGGAGVILDGRGGDGDGFEGVERVISHFISADVFLYVVQDLGGRELDFRSTARADRASVPLIYLVDEQTRGAAELLAVLLQEHRAGLVLGRPTRGDGVIRRTWPLPDGRFVRMASAVLALPDGRTWRGRGVTPHIRVEGDEWKRPEFRPEDMARGKRPLDPERRRHLEVFIQTRQDAVLARAVDILLALQSLSGSRAESESTP
jgi:C-terminal processing protease CtpA/Prc